MDADFSLDMPTLVVARIVSILVFAIAVPIMTLRRNRPETAIFCASLVMAIFSWITILAMVATGNVVITALFAFCISSVVSLQWAAMATLTERRLHAAWFVVPPLGVSTIILLFQLDITEGGLVSALVLSAQLAAASVFVVRHGARVVRTSTALLMALGYAFSFCSAISRPLEAIFLQSTELNPLSGTLDSALPFIASYAGTTLIILSWLAALKDRAETRLADLAFRDELTGLANRRALLERGGSFWRLSRLQGSALSLVVVDLDHFKQVNDRWGHEEGDRVLSAFGKAIRDAHPQPSIAARMGGEEFCLVYLGVEARTVHLFMDDLRDDFADTLRLPDGSPVRFSAGIAQAGPADIDIQSLYRRADDALYNAKAGGRDCTIIGASLAA